MCRIDTIPLPLGTIVTNSCPLIYQFKLYLKLDLYYQLNTTPPVMYVSEISPACVCVLSLLPLPAHT